MHRGDHDRTARRGRRRPVLVHDRGADKAATTAFALRAGPQVSTWAGYGPDAARATVARHARGVLLSRRATDHGDRFEVAIVFEEERAPTPILMAADDTDVIARWRRYAADLGLPLLIEDVEGTILAPWGQIGRVATGPVRIRRRNATLARRRPLFPWRRKPGLAGRSSGTT